MTDTSVYYAEHGSSHSPWERLGWIQKSGVRHRSSRVFGQHLSIEIVVESFEIAFDTPPEPRLDTAQVPVYEAECYPKWLIRLFAAGTIMAIIGIVIFFEAAFLSNKGANAVGVTLVAVGVTSVALAILRGQDLGKVG
jgi:hypothetical protein